MYVCMYVDMYIKYGARQAMILQMGWHLPWDLGAGVTEASPTLLWCALLLGCLCPSTAEALPAETKPLSMPLPVTAQGSHSE